MSYHKTNKQTNIYTKQNKTSKRNETKQNKTNKNNPCNLSTKPLTHPTPPPPKILGCFLILTSGNFLPF